MEKEEEKSSISKIKCDVIYVDICSSTDSMNCGPPVQICLNSVKSASLHLKTLYTTDGANISKDFSEVVNIFKSYCCLSFIFMGIYRLRDVVVVHEAFVPQIPGFLLLLCYCFDFFLNKKSPELFD